MEGALSGQGLPQSVYRSFGNQIKKDIQDTGEVNLINKILFNAEDL